jgi:hypothetical protein
VADQRNTFGEGTILEDRELKVDGRDGKNDRETKPDREIKEVRASDIEPYTGLRYLSKLFRFMAVILVMLLVAEIATGIYTQGSASIPTLLGEASRLIVLAGVLWGTGDLAHLLIDVGHDVRASRILVARVAHIAKVPPLVQQRVTDRTTADRTRKDVAFSDRPVPRRSMTDALGEDDGPPIP